MTDNKHSFLKSLDKEVPFSDSVNNMLRLLKQCGIDIEEASWLNPVSNVWSVHIRIPGCSSIFTNGKGITKEAALASALGEFFERASCGFFFADFFLGTDDSSDFTFHPEELWFDNFEDERLVNNIHKDLYDPDNLINHNHLIDFNSGRTRNICALPFNRESDNTKCYFPVNILDNLYVSNGMAAGNTIYEAKVQALSEIIERNIKNRIIAEGIALPDIPVEILRNIPHIFSAIEELESKGFRVKVKDASLGGRFPVINVTLISRKYGGIYTAFGSHPIFATAIERTVTELLQGRDLSAPEDFKFPSFDIETVKSPINLEDHFIDSAGLFHWNFLKNEPDFPFTEWNFRGTREEEYSYLSDIIEKYFNSDIYCAEYSHLGINVCRIIIPGVSEVYPFTDLTWDNKNSLTLIRSQLHNLDTIKEEDIENLYSIWSANNVNGDKTVAQLLGYADQKGIIAAELSAMLALASGEYEDALIWLRWCSNSGKSDSTRQNLYKCIETILTLEIKIDEDTDKFESSLEAIFGESALEQAYAILDGTSHFPSWVPDPEESEELKGIHKIYNICRELLKKSYC